MPFANQVIEHNREQLARAGGPLPSRFTFEPEQAMALLRSRIVGQDAVLDEMAAMLRVVKAGIGDGERPLAVNLFMGPTGVGKTEIVRLLAQAIHGRADAFCRIDMNTLAQEHYAAALTGAPPGYVGSKEGATLFDVEAIQGSFSRPGIVLFDELEKASREVVRSLLNVLDSGRLTLSAGNRSIDFRNSLIFMTSNIGALQAWNSGWGRCWPGARRAIMRRALHRHFEPEFLNRIDRILAFQALDASRLGALLDIELAKLDQRLARQGRSLHVDDEARRLLCAAHDARFGARDLARRLRTRLEPVLAEGLLAQPQRTHWRAGVRDGRLVVE
ncbi:AAA family ATPase [Stutzerimonas kirkiae]|uniref:AAA family ATPase n=1 Tax=Stutzerimonas kirkiae TaxID=2211392 RepID=A0A4Q9QXJ3_9GAMM|nr:AAA family ATPase [Stutzerimonas kirkiae]TBU89548.1 AAA family ATPase [Stutzerimonas kirkiae]TBU98491.1 AAA family ATPase [Stutzerimonas kirkiae]TBV13791.1 AAA family ATPase [Stutzerimonas kirkiae]